MAPTSVVPRGLPRSKGIRGGFVLEAAAVVGLYLGYGWIGEEVEAGAAA